MNATCDCCSPATFTEEAALGSCRCSDEELPGDPFTALRVAFGMLLGEDDFRVLQGNPRGKQQLHGAWLHGAGVIWGLGLSYRAADGQIVVAPGLALDGRGRELRLEASSCLTVRDWVQAWVADHPAGSADCEPIRQAAGWVVARFRTCLDRPVPAIAEPCDVTRRHDDYSRVVESICIEVVDSRPPARPGYPRVRALLGLEVPAAGIEAEVESARTAVESAPADERAAELVKQFRWLAARDVIELGPEPDDRHSGPVFPRTEEHSGVVLGRISVGLTDEGAPRPEAVEIDGSGRRAILPTTTIQELACGLAPGLLGATAQTDAGGPRLRRDTVTWSKGNTRLEFCVTARIEPGSQESGVEISSLADDGGGWAADDIEVIRLADDGTRVVVELDHPPAYPTVRVQIRGTGATPLVGADPAVPFAGVEGGPPGTADDGHDAVITQKLDPAGKWRTR